jgi:hypothetical protein
MVSFFTMKNINDIHYNYITKHDIISVRNIQMWLIMETNR